jgi:hypothetical protein
MNSSCAITLQQAHYRAIDWFYAFQFHALHPRRHRHREATLLARSRKTMRSKCLQSFYPMIMYALLPIPDHPVCSHSGGTSAGLALPNGEIPDLRLFCHLWPPLVGPYYRRRRRLAACAVPPQFRHHASRLIYRLHATTVFANTLAYSANAQRYLRTQSRIRPGYK